MEWRNIHLFWMEAFHKLQLKNLENIITNPKWIVNNKCHIKQSKVNMRLQFGLCLLPQKNSFICKFLSLWLQHFTSFIFYFAMNCWRTTVIVVVCMCSRGYNTKSGSNGHFNHNDPMSTFLLSVQEGPLFIVRAHVQLQEQYPCNPSHFSIGVASLRAPVDTSEWKNEWWKHIDHYGQFNSLVQP